MARAEIYLEDNGPEIGLVVRHLGGFDPTSNAHKLSMQIVKFLEDASESKRHAVTTLSDEGQPALECPPPKRIVLS